jgi:hypothetical protein
MEAGNGIKEKDLKNCNVPEPEMDPEVLGVLDAEPDPEVRTGSFPHKAKIVRKAFISTVL